MLNFVGKVTMEKMLPPKKQNPTSKELRLISSSTISLEMLPTLPGAKISRLLPGPPKVQVRQEEKEAMGIPV